MKIKFPGSLSGSKPKAKKGTVQRGQPYNINKNGRSIGWGLTDTKSKGGGKK